jgi:hypothetical protein
MQGTLEQLAFLIQQNLTACRLDHCLRLDMLMHFKSCVDLQRSHWTHDLQQSRLRSRKMARHLTHVGSHTIALRGKSLVQEIAQSHSSSGSHLSHFVLLRQYHHTPRDG